MVAGALLLTLAALPAAGAEPSSILASYSFDDGWTDTGPDTFSVFRNARGDVRLSNSFRQSGYSSVEIRDVAGDGDFPELQGYFPARRDGWLVVYFAFLTTDTNEELNMALAGPACFSMSKNGIAFWLSTRRGYLFHTSDRNPKRLLRLKNFTWYGVEVDYDVRRGRYDLRIYEEGIEEPVVSRKDQPNATRQPGSVVSMFSFIGDPGKDTLNVAYYVDDIVVAINRDVALSPLVAPGRRKLFVETLPAPASAAGQEEDPAVRLERAGDEALRQRDLAAAKRSYQEALAETPALSRVLLKLADVHFLLGDLKAEKALREKIFGSLDPK